MSSSVGGFTAPSMITHFCLRTQEEVSSSGDGKEFTRAALFSPLLSLLVFIAIFLTGEPEKKTVLGDEVIPANENTPLAPTSRRKSDGDLVTGGPPRRRKSLMAAARSATIRGSILSTPTTFIEQNGAIYEDDIKNNYKVQLVFSCRIYCLLRSGPLPDAVDERPISASRLISGRHSLVRRSPLSCST